MRAPLADNLLAMDDPGAVDEPVESSIALDRGGHRGFPARLVDNVGAHEADAAAKLRCERFSFGFVQVRDDDMAAAFDDHPRGRGAQPRSAAGDDESAAFQLHDAALRRDVVRFRVASAVTLPAL